MGDLSYPYSKQRMRTDIGHLNCPRPTTGLVACLIGVTAPRVIGVKSCSFRPYWALFRAISVRGVMRFARWRAYVCLTEGLCGARIATTGAPPQPPRHYLLFAS